VAHLFIDSDPELEGVTWIACSAARPRPHVVVLGAVHGNEPAGLAALARLQKEARDGSLPLLDGTLVLVHGNPRASELGTRGTLPDLDLNRLFDFRFEDELPPVLHAYEHHRALSLRGILQGADFVLDLHSTTAPTPPFAIATTDPGSLAVAERLGLGFVTVGWEGPGLLADRVVLAVPTRHQRPAVAVECGGHEDPDAPEVACRVARRFLVVTGLLAPEGPDPSRPSRLRILGALKRPSARFRFDRPIAGMELLTGGRVLGADEHVEIRVLRDCRAVMPNDRVPVGEDMLYLAVEEDPTEGEVGA